MPDRICNLLFPGAGNTALPALGIDKLSRGTGLRQIGRNEGATSSRPGVA